MDTDKITARWKSAPEHPQMTGLGFEVEMLGGGLEGWGKKLSSSDRLLLTFYDGEIGKKPEDLLVPEWQVGVHRDNEEGQSVDSSDLDVLFSGANTFGEAVAYACKVEESYAENAAKELASVREFGFDMEVCGGGSQKYTRYLPEQTSLMLCVCTGGINGKADSPVWILERIGSDGDVTRQWQRNTLVEALEISASVAAHAAPAT